MRNDVNAPADPTYRVRSGVTLTLFKTGTLLDLIAGTTGALQQFDLTPFATTVTQTEDAIRVRLAYTDELIGVNRPKPGQLVQVKESADVVFNGVIDSRSPEIEMRGERSVALVVRRRDAFPWWRDVRRVTPIYSAGADLASIARDIIASLGLAAGEHDIGVVGVQLAHDTTQLADLNAWDMLELIGLPGLKEPYVDARGVFKFVSRDVRRDADIALTYERVRSIQSGRSRPPLTTFRVKYLDPNLTKVTQLEQVLANASLSAGFFMPSSKTNVWWSDDHRLRAENTYLHKQQSINDGLLHVGDESYVQTSPYGGKITARIDGFLPGLATASLAALIASSWIPDEVVVGGLGVSGGVTIPVGRAAQQIALNVLLYTLMVMGFGVYEVRGQPYDYVNAVNEVEAYDENAPIWMEKFEEVQNDLIPNDAVAESLATNELIYRARSADSGVLPIADDLRIERGDMLSIPDGRKFYVTGYQRDLTRGAPAMLDVQGFFV